MAWGFNSQTSDDTEFLLAMLETGRARVPTHWYLEVCNALLVAQRAEMLTPAQTARFVGLLLALPIDADPTTSARALRETRRLAETEGVTSYDAAYLELALREGLPLATLDKGMKRAAGSLGIPLLID